MIITSIVELRKIQEDDRNICVIVADTETEMVGSRKFFSMNSAKKFANACAESDVCEMCEGTGEVSCPDYVYNNEPHMADVGVRKCDCQLD